MSELVSVSIKSQKPIRVAMIAPPWLPIPPSGYGGIENIVAVLVPALQELGVEVELFSVGESKLKKVKNHWLYKEGQYGHIHQPMFESIPVSIAQILFASHIIQKDGKFDIIHDHSGFISSMAFSFDIPNLPPVIHTLHGPPFSTPESIKNGAPDNLPMWKQFKSVKRFYLAPISKALIKNAPTEVKKILVPVVYNAVDTKLFKLVKEKSDYFITLGRFHPEKGQHIAAKLCMELGYKLKMAGLVGTLTRPDQILLQLANPLSEYRSLADFKYYSDKIFPYLFSGLVENIGEVKGAKKISFISNARALLFPIQWNEPFGVAAIEALACGTPVVAMARGALPEIIEHGVNGFLANTESEFKKYMQKVGEINPEDCRRSVEKNFSGEKMAKTYLQRYKTIIERDNKKTKTHS